MRQLSNPYGIATLFGLTPQETTLVIPIAKALIGLRSAVVIRTPAGDVQTRRIPAGSLTLHGKTQSITVELDEGADAIMETVGLLGELQDVEGEPGTNVGGMIERVRQTMSDVTEKPAREIKSATSWPWTPSCPIVYPAASRRNSPWKTPSLAAWSAPTSS